MYHSYRRLLKLLEANEDILLPAPPRAKRPKALRPWLTLSLCAPGARPGARSPPPPPSRPATPRTPPAGSDRPLSADAHPAPTRKPPPQAASVYGVVAVLWTSQSPSSANLTLSLSPSILAPAAFRRTIEFGRSTFRL